MAEIKQVNDLSESSKIVLGAKICMLMRLSDKVEELKKELGSGCESFSLNYDDGEVILKSKRADGAEMELHWHTDEAGTITIF